MSVSSSFLSAAAVKSFGKSLVSPIIKTALNAGIGVGIVSLLPGSGTASTVANTFKGTAKATVAGILTSPVVDESSSFLKNRFFPVPKLPEPTRWQKAMTGLKENSGPIALGTIAAGAVAYGIYQASKPAADNPPIEEPEIDMPEMLQEQE